jgi:hypothetical protein
LALLIAWKSDAGLGKQKNMYLIIMQIGKLVTHNESLREEKKTFIILEHQHFNLALETT